MRGKILAGFLGFLLLLSFLFAGSLVENVDADEIMVVQSPGGTLSVYSAPGWKWQGFGKVTSYRRRSIYSFETKVRFNDGAHGLLKGSIQYELPLDDTNLIEIHTKFGSQGAVQTQLVETVVDKAVYMTGPLMSSKESYAEKRNELINFVEEQVSHGVFRTRQRDVREKDEITGVEKTVTVVEIVKNADGSFARQEEATLTEFGVKTFNFAITDLDYEEQVEAQIAAQQKATMDVQTAMSQSRQAEQRALTAEKEGQANAAKAKWEQEVLKAKAVTLAQQEKEVAVTEAQRQLEVATLAAESAEQYRVKRLKEAEGDATYKQKVLAADGALQQKLDAYVQTQQAWAEAFADRQVPTTVFGSSGGAGSDGDVQTFMQLLNAAAAKNLSLDLTTKP